MVMTVSVILYKDLGISNTDIALYTSWLYLPWVIKPLWSPVVDLLKTRRLWIWTLQLVLGGGFAGVAMTLPAEDFFRWSLALFWLAAFSSATHDVAADGFYMLALSERQQSFFVGIRSTFYRIANITGQGLLVMFAGALQERTGNPRLGWMWALGALAVLLILAGLYHARILPRPANDVPVAGAGMSSFLRQFFETFGAFFRKRGIGLMLLFLLVYRLGESLLVKMAMPFLRDMREVGGLGLTTQQIGFAYGTVGVIALTLGGILGGMLIARNGLRRWLWPMVCLMNVPNALYILLAYFQPEVLGLVVAAIALEQFGYGFGFAAYLMYMIYIARGSHQTAHYALCTGFMALGMMLPGMVSGALQEWLGYPTFFVWVLLATIPGFAACVLVPLEKDFGRRTEPAH
jgi:PAT family beta-lactamase induction signal transducer AmpG